MKVNNMNNEKTEDIKLLPSKPKSERMYNIVIRESEMQDLLNTITNGEHNNYWHDLLVYRAGLQHTV